jgi:hypothetical protein
VGSWNSLVGRLLRGEGYDAEVYGKGGGLHCWRFFSMVLMGTRKDCIWIEAGFWKRLDLDL